MAVLKQILTDANIFMGKNNCVAIGSQITPPDIKYESLEIKPLAGVGVYKVNTGKVEAMEAKIVLDCFYETIFDEVADPTAAVEMTIYGNLGVISGDSIISNKPAKLYLRGVSAQLPLLGDMKAQENINFELTFNISAARLEVNGAQLYEIDFQNNILKVGNKNLRAEINKNLGLA